MIGVIPFLIKSLISILPICDMAAVTMQHFDPSSFTRSTMQTAVKGLTKNEEA